MLILTVNSGSTSVKLSAFESTAEKASPVALRSEQHSGSTLDHAGILAAFVRALGPQAQLDAVAHRVVHGGTRFVAPVRIDAQVRTAIVELSELAPLHNPVALRWIDAAGALWPERVIQIAAFDTAYFAGMPRVASEYALPAAVGAQRGVRRYGFHGLAHQAMAARWAERHPTQLGKGRLITLQLGGGCSATAVAGGRPLDTSMGFSPLEGLVMATRSGDVDAAIVPYLARRLEVSAERVLEILNEESGLLGVSGRSSDMRVLLASEDAQARFAVDLYCYRARKCVGALLAALGGCDAIVFGGGVGEHAPAVRERIVGPLSWAGVELDAAANAAALGAETCISRHDSPISVEVIPVDEAHVLAAAALSCL